jgi:hypothetical protein
MTIVIPKKENETLGEIRERVSRLTKREAPDWWQKKFLSLNEPAPGTPTAKEPPPEKEDDDDVEA